ASRYAFPAKRITPASPHKPAFVYRWGAENERQNSHAGPPAQPAFVYRWGAENERQNGRGGPPPETGVRLPLGGGKGTPVGMGRVARRSPGGVRCPGFGAAERRRRSSGAGRAWARRSGAQAAGPAPTGLGELVGEGHFGPLVGVGDRDRDPLPAAAAGGDQGGPTGGIDHSAPEQTPETRRPPGRPERAPGLVAPAVAGALGVGHHDDVPAGAGRRLPEQQQAGGVDGRLVVGGVGEGVLLGGERHPGPGQWPGQHRLL